MMKTSIMMKNGKHGLKKPEVGRVRAPPFANKMICITFLTGDTMSVCYGKLVSLKKKGGGWCGTGPPFANKMIRAPSLTANLVMS